MQPANISPLAKRLRKAISKANVTASVLAEKTKIPRGTILSLIEEPVSAILPERVYLRGQVQVLAQELGMDIDEVTRLFEEAYPVPRTVDVIPDREISRTSIMVAAGLGGIAIIAVVLAFVS